MKWHASSTIMAGLLMLLSACGPVGDRGQSQSTGPSEATGKRKTLTIGIQREPGDFIGFVGDTVGGGVSHVRPIAHDSLVVENEKAEQVPVLAAEGLSVEKGTWRINADGTMDTIWRLKPNVKWHDGAPFTAADLLFTFTVYKDPETPRTIRGRPDLMQSAAAPDPLTFTVHWSGVFAQADQAEAVDRLLPKHLLEDLHQKDKAAFVNSPHFTTEFIGLGPYRLASWVQGSHMEFTRFEDYHQGRPRFDGVTVRFLGDSNTMVANILSGTLDVVLPDGVDIDAAAEVKRRWEGTDNEVRFDVLDSLANFQAQFRPDVARPSNGAANRTVRQALFHAIDRKALAEVTTGGLAPVADSWFPPGHALRSELEASIPQFPFDPARAQQLLREAGWSRGSDGVLVHGQTGERFETQLWAYQADEERGVLVVSDGWKAVGVSAQPHVIPPNRRSDREYDASFPAFILTSPNSRGFYEDGRWFHSRFSRSAANRWTGTNRAGYENPRADVLLDQLAAAVDPRERIPLHRQFLQEVLTDVGTIPLYWEVVPVLSLGGIKSHKVVKTTATWNFFEWDRR